MPKRLTYFLALLCMAIVAPPSSAQQPQPQAPVPQQPAQPERAPPPGKTPPPQRPNDQAPGTTQPPAPTKPAPPPPQPVPPRAVPERRLLPPPTAGAGDMVSLNFSRADLVEIIHILAQHLRLTYTIDPEVKGTVTIHSAEPLRREDLLPIFHQVLRMNGAVAVKSGNIYRITPIKDAKGLARPTGQSREDSFALQVVPVRFFSVAEMKKILTPFLAPGGEIIEYPRGNFLVIMDLPSNIQRLVEIADLIDVQVFAGTRMEIYQPKVASAEELAAEMTKVMQSFAGSAPQTDTFTAQFIPLPRINQLLVISHSEAAWTYARRWLERIDVIAEGPGRRIFIYPVENGKATELADVLNQALGLQATGRRETSRTLQDLHRSTPGSTGLTTGSRPPTSPSTGTPGTTLQQSTPLGGAFATVPVPGQPPAPATPPPPGVPATPGVPRPPTPPAPGTRPDEQLRIVPDPATNSLIIYGTAQEFQNIRNILKSLDLMPRQVMLDVLVAEVTLDDDHTFGVEYEVLRRGGDVRIFNREFGSRGGVLSGLLSGLPAPAAGALSQFPSGVSGVIGTGNAVRAFINALQSDSRVRILSSPTVLATDNRPARIQVGTEEPIATGTVAAAVGGVAQSTSIQYRNTGRIVTIIPQVNSLGLVNLQILAEVSQRGVNVLVGSDTFPSFDTRQAETTAVVQDGETLAIGGIIADNRTRDRTGIPYLMDIPIIGRFFGTTADTLRRTELIMLITPRVIRTVAEARDATGDLKGQLSNVRNELERLDRERAKMKPQPPQPDAPVPPAPSVEPTPIPKPNPPAPDRQTTGEPPKPSSQPSSQGISPPGRNPVPAEPTPRESPAPAKRAENDGPPSKALELRQERKQAPALRPFDITPPLPGKTEPGSQQSVRNVSPSVKIETDRPAKGPPPPVSAKVETGSQAPSAMMAKTSPDKGEPVQQWLVQVASFDLERDANNLAQKLKQKGYDSYVMKADVGTKTWYRVRVGRLSNQEDALELQQKLKAAEKFDQAIVIVR